MHRNSDSGLHLRVAVCGWWVAAAFGLHVACDGVQTIADESGWRIAGCGAIWRALAFMMVLAWRAWFGERGWDEM
eukprot:5095693-Alexandrium_andersonii.AAC.1